VAILFREYEVVSNSGLFDAEYYLRTNPELVALNIDPLLHYVERGAREGRSPRPDFDVAYYLEQCRRRGEEPSNPLLHFITIGAQEGLKTRVADLPVVAVVPPTRSEPEEQDALILGVDSAAVEKMSDDSLQLILRGWAIADDSIAQISMSWGEQVLGFAAYGFPRPDVAAVHSDFPKADHSGFVLVVDSLPEGVPDTLELSLTVEFAGGSKCLRPFTFNLVTSEFVRTSRDRDRPRPASHRHPTTPPLRLEVDDIEVNARGVLEASGWVVCFLDIEAIRLFVGDECLGTAEYGRVREDVARTCPEYPRARQSGFQFKGQVAHLGHGHRMVKIQALSQSGITREAMFPITIPQIAAAPVNPEAFHYHCDELALTTRGDLSISGWAVPSAATESIVLRIDDAQVGLAKLNIERPDVGNLFNQLPHARHAGFAFRQSLNLELAAGEHTLTLQIKDQAGGVRELPLSIQAVEPDVETPAIVTDVLDGDPDHAMWIDSPKIVNGAAETSVTSSLSIGGWALASKGVKAIIVAVDGNPIAQAHYGMRRSDVAARYPQRADAMMSGFAALIANWSLPKGQHKMSITLLDKEGKSASVEFGILVEEISEGDGPWALRRKITQFEIDLQTRILVGLKWKPAFRLLIKLHNSADGVQKARITLGSLRSRPMRTGLHS